VPLPGGGAADAHEHGTGPAHHHHGPEHHRHTPYPHADHPLGPRPRRQPPTAS
jgi:sirohydrochlorin cobaltochelatase